jgi:hypothetical protein
MDPPQDVYTHARGRFQKFLDYVDNEIYTLTFCLWALFGFEISFIVSLCNEASFLAAAGSTAATDVSGSRVDGQRFLFVFRDVLVMTRS